MSKKKRLDLNKEELEKLLQEAWNDILSRYHHPLIRERPKFQWTTKLEKAIDDKGIERERNLTYIEMGTHRTIVAEDTLQNVLPYISSEAALKGLLLHEMGHYCNYPKDLATLLFLGQAADTSLGKDLGKAVIAKYLDIVDDIDNLRSSTRKTELVELYRGLSLHFNNLIAAETEKKDELMERTKPNRLVFAYYQHILGQDWGIPLEDDLKQKLEDMKSIDFNSQTDYSHSLSLIALGNVMKDIIKFSSKGNNPLNVDGNVTLDKFSDEQFEEALNKIAKNHSKLKYDQIKVHLKKELGKRAYDLFENRENRNKSPGYSRTFITFNDDDIEYYVRMAALSGVYIAKKPLTVDVKDPYPEKCSEFSVGDPISKLNIFSSGGKILPAITKKFDDGYGIRPDKKYSIPDAVIILDSSGSMAHPSQGSHAVLAGFILAMNYHKNGKKVGVMNFSSDLYALEPTRDIDAVYSTLCAYYGAGTTLNLKKVQEYFFLLSRNKLKKNESNDRDYSDMMKALLPGNEGNTVNGNIEEKIIEIYDRIDNFIITDGGISNLKEMIGYVNVLSKYTRNTIFLINNNSYYNELVKLDIPNTHVIDVRHVSDLTKLAIGKAKKVFIEGK